MSAAILHGGGVEQFIVNVLSHIDSNRYQIEVLLPSGRSYEREPDLLEMGIPVRKYDCSSWITKIRQLRDIICEDDIDIVHFHTGHESAISYWATVGTKAKVVCHAHTSMSGDENKSFFHLRVKDIGFFYSRLIYGLTTRLACSEEAAAFLFGSKGARILFNGIDLSRFEAESARKNKFSICINARLNEQKNPLFILEVISSLKKLNPGITVEWIGVGELEEVVKNKINELSLEETVKMLGAVANPEKVLARNRYFLLPSLYEGLGIAVIEAQAMGLLCFVSDKVPKLADCGGCHYISLNKAPEEWARIMDDSMQHEEKPSIEMGQLRLFDIKHTVKQLEEIYDKVCATNERHRKYAGVM